MQFEPWLIALIWLLWLGTGAQCALGVNGYLVEQREGMRISRLRICLLAGIFAIASILAITVTFLPRQPIVLVAAKMERAQSANPQLEGLEKQNAEVRTKLDQNQAQQRKLQEQSQELKEQEHDLAQRIDAEKGVKANAVRNVVRDVEEFDWRNVALFSLAVLAILLLVGFFVLALGGQIQSLFPEGWAFLGPRNDDYESLQQNLDALAALVLSEQYREAMEKAESIPNKKLRSFDQLDYFFLRAYSAVQAAAFPKTGETAEQRREWLKMAVEDLEVVTAEAPKRPEALYTLAIAYGLSQKHAEALRCFEASQPLLRSEKNLPFEHNESVCLLRLAESSLTAGNNEQAESYFARVAELGKLADSVVQSRVRIGMIDLRNAMNKQDIASASAALAKIAGLRNLSKEQKAQVDVICSALNARTALRRDDAQLALTESQNFLAAYLPAGLPELDDETADEPFSPVVDADLPFPREVYQSFLFIQAVALSRLWTKGHGKLTEARIAGLGEPLLRALQLIPRHRDVLGALGGLYYWFRPEKRADAREWLEAAVLMGVGGRIVRIILERDRLVEMERRDALDWFRSASSRFLRDPALAGDVRRALVEELGRFQEFEPMLISLKEKPELEQEEPTMQGLRDRTRYLADVLARIALGGQTEKFARLAQIQAEYSGYVATLEQAAQNISALERRVFSELADTLILR